MGLPPTPVSARPAACTPGPLCPSYICVNIFLSPLPGPFILCLSPSHSPPAFPPSSSHEGEKKKKKRDQSFSSLHPPLPPLISASLFVSRCCCFSLIVTLHRALISLVVAAQLILPRYRGLLFTSHQGLLPRPPASPGNADG